MSINLLPDELKPKSSTIRVYKGLKKASILFVSFCALIIFVIGGVILVITNFLNISQKKQDSLKSQIVNLEQTETRLVLIRDRLSKIGELQGSYETKSRIEGIRSLIETVSQDVTLTQIGIDSKGISLKADFVSPAQMTAFITKLSGMTEYSSIKLDSMKFIVGKGYEATLFLGS